MKKQILFISMTISALVLVSCSKNNMELPAANAATAQESNSASVAAENSFFINPLLIKLDGWYRFNGNLQDALGKLSPGVPIGLAPKYTSDRKGVLNSALKLDGSFFVKLFNVPQQTASSIAVWVKTFHLNQNLGIISGNPQGMGLVQNPNKWVGGLTLISGGWSVSSVIPKDASDLHWHHLAVTYDGSSLKFYVDAALAGSSNMPGSISSALTNYIVGNGYWKGAVDDLHFYSRTLSASDVTALYNQ